MSETADTRASRPRRRRRAEHRRRHLDGPALPGLRRRVGRHRRRRARRGRRLQAAPDRARRDAARHGGLRRRPAARRRSARGCRSSSSPRATRPRTRSAASRSAATTTSPSRSASRSSSRASARSCAAPALAEPESSRLVVRGPRARRGRARGHARRRARRADRDRVPPAALPHAQPAPRAHPRAAARARLGLRLRRRRPRARDLRQLPAQEARRPRPAADPHRARRRLRAAPARGRDAASLRARLLAGVLALAAVGAARCSAAITYAEQRSFLLRRASTSRRARRRSRSRARARRRRRLRPGRRRPRPRSAAAAARRPAAPTGLPAGTYGERRDARRRRVGDADRASATAQDVTADARRCPTHVPGRASRSPSTARTATARATACSPQRRPFATATITIVAVPLRDVDQTLDRLLVVEALVIAGVLLAARRSPRGSSCASACGRSTAWATPPARSPAATSRTASSPTDPRTEVGRLGIALNAMLDRLERAFAERQASEDRLRQFLADASHELRTPLASIRGYAELFRMGAAREPADIEKAMRRIEEEAARMGVLVEDLLDARAPRRGAPTRRTPRSTSAALARDAVDDARATAPDRDDRRSTPTATRAVLGDAHQLRQVLANLLRNALVHTPAGTPIEVDVARDGRRRPPRGARPRPGPARRRRRARCSSASGAPRAAASAAARAPASASRSSPGSSTPTAAASSAAQRARRRRVVRRAPARGISAASALRRLSGRSHGAPTGRADAGPMTEPPSSTRSARGRAQPRARPRRRHRRPRLQRGGGARAEHPPPAPLPDRRLPVRLADRDRRQREHRRHAARSRAALAAALPRRRGPAPGAQGPRPRAARRLVGAATREVVCYMDVDLSTDLRALLPLVAPLLSGHSDVAIGTRLAHGARVVRGPKRELISRSYNRLLHATLRARFSDAQCGFKAVRARRARRRCCRRRATTAGSSTPSCSCSPSAAACASTRCRSTGSTTPTRASTSSAPRSSDLRGVARLRAAGPVARFLADRRARTLAYALLYLLLRGPLGADGRERRRAGDHRRRQHRRQPPADVRRPRARRASLRQHARGRRSSSCSRSA